MWDDENDMDELFRTAAQGYPLKRAADSWEVIVPLLKDEATDHIGVKKRNGFQLYHSLLAMIIVVLIFSGLATNDGLIKRSSVLNANSNME